MITLGRSRTHLLLGNVCPWEATNWFPCETDGVACVGATEYSTRDRASYSNYGDSVKYWATGAVLTGADPAKRIGRAYQVQYGTSFASPFIAGNAAMTSAADPDQSAGQVEACLAAARNQGPNGRFVSTRNAVACALGYPASLPPLVKITEPVEDTQNYSSVGTVRLTARADDFESGVIDTIFWSSDVEGSLGTTQSDGFLLYTPSGPGPRTVTARAFDPEGNPGTDSVVLSFEPAPPVLQIAVPAAGDKVYLGVPQDLIGRVTNFKKLGERPPCGSARWTGFFNNSIAFDNLVGCSAQATFINLGPGKVDFSMTIDGALGKTSRSFRVVDDPNLRIKITSPLRTWADGQTEPVASLVDGENVTLSAASNHDLGVTAPIAYQWEVSTIDGAGTKVVLATLTGSPTSYTVPALACGFTDITIKAMGVDALGELDDDEIKAHVFTSCEPT